MSYELQPYDPSVHARPLAGSLVRYAQTHVVVGDVPLTDINFDPRHDQFLASIEAVGHRTPGSCPRFDELTANATTPPIIGADTNQQLKIPCILRVEMAVSPTAYPVCIAKAAKLKISPDDFTEAMLTNRETYQLVSCPFMYLGAAVVGSAGEQVKVALDASNPLDPAPIDVTKD